MKPFMDETFLLPNQTAHRLYQDCAADLPILDFHNHLSPQEIYEDRCFDNIAQVWLGGDHYKWRAMRANGVAEEKITGNAPWREKFDTWADTVSNCFGNPLYHWTHLELQRYFNVRKTLSLKTADEIWETCNALLQTPEYSVRNLLRRQNVEALCTTDDPADDLKWHRLLAEEGFEIKVLPSFRPGNVLDIEKAAFPAYLNRLSDVSKKDVSTLSGLLDAVVSRLDFFVENGCRVTDHSLEGLFFVPATKEQAEAVYQKRLLGQPVTAEEAGQYRGYVLTQLGRKYARRSLVMQFHIGALRNNSDRMFTKLGADSGFDSIHDFSCAKQLSGLLNEMDKSAELPRTILYNLNPKDTAMLASMAGNFQGNETGIRSKIQLGSAWWFQDHISGMEQQMDILANIGLLSGFVGMLTDSRSFLSFPRHEYFRRILCRKIGTAVENGEFPDDPDVLFDLVQKICYQNAKEYFRF